MAVFFPHQSLPSYSPTGKNFRFFLGGGGPFPPPKKHIFPHSPSSVQLHLLPFLSSREGQVYSETDLVTSSLPLMEEGALYSGWLTQPPPATLQPLTQWTTSPDYVSHEAVSCPYTADMFVQPVCPSYTLVGTSSVLTYTSQPLITNFTARSASSPAVVPHLDAMDQQAPLSYFPWTQPIPTLPATSLQYQPAPMALSAPQFVPLPISGADPLPQVLEDTRKEMAPLTLEKLLQDDTNDTYDLNNSLPV
uniref:POU class 2 homeobox associating factor 1 n=1 Tax=Laticauda laticaudata TaxID=8630 RepID=A0A8C5WX55_LATLA